jgi:hypothetical protein
MFYGKKRYGIALYHTTQEYFLLLPDTVVIIACTQIYHAISEYSSGQRKTTKFEGDEMECKWPQIAIIAAELLTGVFCIAVYNKLHIAWYEQSDERRTKLLKLLLDGIRDYMGLDQQEKDPERVTTSIPNVYKDRLDDLEELEKAGQEGTEVEEVDTN